MATVKEMLDYLRATSRFPPNTVRRTGRPDPVHSADLMNVVRLLSSLVDRLGIKDFALRNENWSGLAVVYDMDAPEPRRRLREALEELGFTVTVRRNEYGISLEVHPREADLIMTRFDRILDTIAEALPEASDMAALKAGVDRRLGHSGVPVGVLDSAITMFNNSLVMRREGKPAAERATPGMRRLIEESLETGVVPPLCTLLDPGEWYLGSHAPRGNRQDG